MKKDFAFLFYVNDWAGGTQWMTRLQRGAYLDLLLFQVSNTCFTSEQLKTILGEDIDVTWPALKCKFIEENGNFYNAKLREVVESRRKFTTSRSENRKGKTKEKEITYVNHMEKEKENEIDIVLINNTTEEDLKNSHIWHEQVGMSLRLKDTGAVKVWINKFCNEMKAKETFLGRPLKELKSHFVSWAKIEISKEAKGPKKTDEVYVRPISKEGTDKSFIQKFYSEANTGETTKPGGLGDQMKKHLGK